MTGPIRPEGMRGIDEISKAAKHEKISILESLSQTAEPSEVRKIAALLNDPDIEVRGEAFGALVSNRNDISETLIGSLNDEERNVRAFASLVLGNRRAREAVGPLRRLTADQSPTVRSCALGALGYLKAGEAAKEIHDCFADDDMEVRKSALRAAMDIRYDITRQELESFSKESDDEMKKLIIMAEKSGGYGRDPRAVGATPGG